MHIVYDEKLLPSKYSNLFNFFYFHFNKFHRILYALLNNINVLTLIFFSTSNYYLNFLYILMGIDHQNIDV